MRLYKIIIISIFSLCLIPNLVAQKKFAEFGIVLRPIFESSAFRTGPITVSSDEMTLVLRQKSGFAYGAIIRYGITKGLNFEGGLTITTRNINLDVSDTVFDIYRTSDFKFITYELPIQVMTKVPIKNNLFVTASGGFVFDFLPSDLESFSENGDFYHRTFYKSWIQGAVSANIGLEYATKASGNFYLGASFHQPFTDLTVTRIETQKRINGRVEDHVLITNIPGSYLTLDFRYFFPENKNAPEPK